MPALVLTPEELEALLARALEPIRAELARLRHEREEEGVPVAEAARRLGVSTRTIRRRVRDGSLPAVRVGGARRVLLSGVLAEEAHVRGVAEDAAEG